MLTDRELATFIVIGATFLICVAVPRVRRFLTPLVKDVLNAALSPKIVAIYVALLVWVCFAVAIGWRLHIWDIALLKDTAVITITLAFPLLFAAGKFETGAEVVKTVIKQTLGLSVVLAFYIGLASFPLWAELVIQLFLVVLALVSGIAQHKGISSVVGCVGLVVVVLFVGTLVWTTVTLFVNASIIDWGDTWRSFFLSLWLPVAIIPFTYIAAFAIRAEVLLLRLNFHGKAPARVQLAFMLGLQFRLKYAAKFDGRYRSLERVTTFREGLRVMREFREDAERRIQEEADHVAHQAALVGVEGTDGEGAQLDRREFRVTKDRLEWIWTTQIGRYEKNGNRYWDDLTDMMVSASRYGLPADHGFVTEVTADGQQWRAWRTLPIGWVLGVGGGNGEVRQYFYSAAVSPTTWPLDSPEDWVSDILAERQPDWRHWDGKFHA